MSTDQLYPADASGRAHRWRAGNILGRQGLRLSNRREACQLCRPNRLGFDGLRYNNLFEGLSNVPNANIYVPFLVIGRVPSDTFIIGDSENGYLGAQLWTSLGFHGVSSRHGEGANYLSAGGQVEYHRTEDLNTEKTDDPEPRLLR